MNRAAADAPFEETKLDSVRERIAATELRRARTIVRTSGAVALLSHAAEQLTEASRCRADETSGPSAGRVNAMRRHNRLELACEVDLAVLARLNPTALAALEPISVLSLCTTPGRWSRRVEALDVVRRRGGRGLCGEALAKTVTALVTMASSGEHRWVQPAALDALAELDPRQAQRMADNRLDHPGGGDDFLVRERIVCVAGRRRWENVLEAAAFDPSEHVRITAARISYDVRSLSSTARVDHSPRVRAAALVSLTRHSGGQAAALLAQAVERDASALVVRVAAAELVGLSRDGRLEHLGEISRALSHAQKREDLTGADQAKLDACSLEVSVRADPELFELLDTLGALIRRAPDGGGLRLRGDRLLGLSDASLGRVLALLAEDDFALSVQRRKHELVIFRGEPRVPRLWRFLHEVMHPASSKRQGFIHTWGRQPRGTLRAPPGRLAELTATSVPGERVLSRAAGGWGRQLPLLDDLLAIELLRATPVTLAGPSGMTVILPPAGFFERVRARIVFTVRYASLSNLRRRSIESDEADVRRAFLDEVERATKVRVSFFPHPMVPHLRASDPIAPPARLSPSVASVWLPVLGTLQPVRDAFARVYELVGDYLASPSTNRLTHVAMVALVMLIGLLARGVFIRRSIDGARKRIPLVVGGWGTRGKSGTERLKAGLFQGLGYECLVKTTGCEAMVIHAIPGMRAREVFLYRPYDKATVWEQRDVLSLADKLHVDVLLWECMALQPDLVDLLQNQWMRDDYSTITNAYPDHEDVQGPSGYDVADVISSFVPTGGNLFTSEEQMLPILRERAAERATAFHAVTSHDVEMISDELLDRFPYREHPANVGLVAALAEEMGIDPSVAIVEMADHVTPDLGVLKTYPSLEVRGRRLTFTNGMSANERTGALANWERAHFARHDPESSPGTRLVVLVNNRADRLARSEVFARFLVEDIGAHRHVLIGTNVAGLLRFIRAALKAHLVAIDPTRDLPEGREGYAVARSRIKKALALLHVGPPDVHSLARELDATGLPTLGPEVLGELIKPTSPDESYELAAANVGSHPAVAGLDEGARAFVVELVARRRTAAAVGQALDMWHEREPDRLREAFVSAYRQIFEASLVVLDDSTLSGDRILDILAASVPPKAHARIMGVQNIKGTGLDFVYRWVSLDVVAAAMTRLESPDEATRADAIDALMAHEDWGLFDATWAARETLRSEAADPARDRLPYPLLRTRLEGVMRAKRDALNARSGGGGWRRVRHAFGVWLDHLDAIGRRRRAETILRSLQEGKISHDDAALRMRELVARQKGAWAQKSSSTVATARSGARQ